MKLLRNIIAVLIIILLPTFSLAYDTSGSYIWSVDADSTMESSSDATEVTSEIEDNNTLNLESGAAILIEQTTGQILYAHNIHEQLRPASVTKIMSILLIMEQIDSGALSYSDTISCSETASSMGGSQIWLDPTETLTVDEMLKAICVVSANDCVVAMAEHIAGSEEAFVQMMNDKAKALGMNDTCFKNCHGIDEDGHVTSAYDIALMSRELLQNHPDVTKYTTIWMDTLRDGKSELVNTNKLIRTYKGITGLKTGSTSLALYNLSASATRDDLSLIAVVMKAPSSAIRFNDATALLNYGFSNFNFTILAKANDVVQTVQIQKGTSSTVNAIFENDCGALVSKGNNFNIDKTISINSSISAPISKGDVLGTVTFTLDDEVISTVNLVSDSDISKRTFWSMCGVVFNSCFNLLRK